MKHLSNDQKDCPNKHKNSHKQCGETSHQILNMMESQWDNHMIRSSNEGKAIIEQVLVSEERN